MHTYDVYFNVTEGGKRRSEHVFVKAQNASEAKRKGKEELNHRGRKVYAKRVPKGM